MKEILVNNFNYNYNDIIKTIITSISFFLMKNIQKLMNIKDLYKINKNEDNKYKIILHRFPKIENINNFKGNSAQSEYTNELNKKKNKMNQNRKIIFLNRKMNYLLIFILFIFNNLL